MNFKALLCGKISLYDYDREAIQSILNYEGQLLPPFMEDMDEYHRCLDVIADTNHIHEFEPTGESILWRRTELVLLDVDRDREMDNSKFIASQKSVAEKSTDENKN